MKRSGMKCSMHLACQTYVSDLFDEEIVVIDYRRKYNVF